LEQGLKGMALAIDADERKYVWGINKIDKR
jgi:hypothetical protein